MKFIDEFSKGTTPVKQHYKPKHCYGPITVAPDMHYRG